MKIFRLRMKLKKMISVCLLFVLLLAGSLWIDQTMRSSEKTKPEEVAEEMAADTEKMTESMSHLSYTKYYVHAQEGYVVICQADHETVYCETSIRVEHLPEELQSSLEEGIALYSDEELYEFLENYSSGPWGSESLKVYNYPDKYNVRNHEYK